MGTSTATSPSFTLSGRWGVAKAGMPALLGIAIIGGAALRLYHVGFASLWGDEACMLEMANYPARSIIEVLASPNRPDVDVAPPLYFLLLRLFTQVTGLSVVTARLFSVLAGIGSIYAVYRLGRRIFSESVGTVAALLLGFSAFHVWYSQEARMYTLVTVLGILATDRFIEFLVSGRGLFGYLAFAICALYTQYYAYLLVFSHIVVGLVYLYRRPAGRPSRLLVPMFVTALSSLAWLPVVLRDYHLASTLDRGFSNHFSLLWSAPFVFAKFALFANENFARSHWPLFVAFAPFYSWYFCRGVLAIDRKQRGVAPLLAGFLLLPLVMVLVATSMGAPVYKSHPFILFSPFFYLLVAHGLTRARGRRGAIVLCLFLGANLFVMGTLNFGTVYTKPRVKEALAEIGRHAREGDLLLKVPAKLHGQPVETGEILSWRYYTPSRLELVELNGSDLSTALRRLRHLTEGRNRFFLVLAESRYMIAQNRAILARCREAFHSTIERTFGSGIRDFGLELYLFERGAEPAPEQSGGRDLSGIAAKGYS